MLILTITDKSSLIKTYGLLTSSKKLSVTITDTTPVVLYKQRQTQVKNEIHNLLQRANIKLTSYLSDIFSKTGQELLSLFINGETIDDDTICSCIHKLVKASPEELLESINVRLSLEDRFLLNQSLEEYRMNQELIDKLTSEIQAYIKKELP